MVRKVSSTWFHLAYSTNVLSPMISTDYNECLISNGGCDQICRNLIPGRECDCEPGFVLNRDGTTCIPNAFCIDTDGNFQCTCLPGYEDTTGMAFNCSGKSLREKEMTSLVSI